MGKNWGRLFLLVTSLSSLWSMPSYAEKKDFKGLFGSYRREKFTENEARSTDLGVDILLSTLIPVSSISSMTEDRTIAPSPMSSSTFFNVEASFFLTINYNWELFINLGYYNYDTRRQNTLEGSATLPLFTQFSMEAYPAVLGARYRFSTSDIVPYVGLAAGVSYVKRTGSYDYNTVNFDVDYSYPITAEAILGLEFYFSSRAGIRLEMSAYYFALQQRLYDPTGPTGSAADFPIISYEANPWLIRYASGVFFLF